MNESAARRALVRYSHALHTAGWVANHDGNLSVRVAAERIVCTPTALSKADVGIEDLVVCDARGRKTAGARKPFSELVLHTAIYGARSDVQAVVHAHPPFATAFGVSGRPLPHPFLPEAVVSLGAEIPTVPLTAPGAASAEALREHVRRCDAVLIAGNGALAWGPSLEVAYLRLELVEHLCRVAHAALPLGGPRPLPADQVAALVKKRATGGLAAPDEGQPPSSEDRAVRRAVARVVASVPNVDLATAEQIASEIAAQLTRS